MEIIDKFFELMFARFRRNTGDSQIAFAWTRASYRTTVFILLPVCGCVALTVLCYYSLFKIGTPAELKRSLTIAAAPVGLIVSVLLDRRFKKYLVSPPLVQPRESRAETRYIRLFSAGSLAVFGLICLAAYMLHEVSLS